MCWCSPRRLRIVSIQPSSEDTTPVSPLVISFTLSRTKFINWSYPFSVPVTVQNQPGSPSRLRRRLTLSATVELHRDLLVHVLVQVKDVLLLPLGVGGLPTPSTPSTAPTAATTSKVAALRHFGVLLSAMHVTLFGWWWRW